jgi:hypothetical protein
MTPDEEVAAVVESIGGWLPEHPDSTVAVLVPRMPVMEVISALTKKGRPPELPPAPPTTERPWVLIS